MKKALLLAVIAMHSLTAFPQKGTIKGSINAGINIAIPVGPDATNLRRDIEEDVADAQKAGGTASGGLHSRFGIHLGGTVNYFVTDKISLGSGLIYSQRGYSYNFSREIPETYIDKTGKSVSYSDKSGNSVKYKFDYLDMPLLFKYYASNSFYWALGPQICIVASDKGVYKNEYTEGGNSYFNYGDPPTLKTNTGTSSLPGNKGLIFGFQLGGGFTGEKIGFNFGISKTGEAVPGSGGGYGFPNLTLQFGMTYAFDLKIPK